MTQKTDFITRGLLGSVLALLVACGPSNQPPSQGRAGSASNDIAEPSIYVVNYPLLYFTKRIVGDHAQVVLPETSGSDPAFWKPSDQEILAYQKADLILLWGADFAKWVEGVSLPSSRVVDTGAGISDRYIYEEDAVVHSHGDSPEHSHGSIAFTTWLDFELMVLHCRQITEILSNRFPENAAEFAQSVRSLESDLRDLDQLFKAAVPENFTETVFASHPVYQYFERRYGVKLQNFHWEPGRTPDEAEWEKFEKHLGQTNARWMLWEGTPSEETNTRMRALGVTPIEFPLVAGNPTSGDFLSIMNATAGRLKESFQTP